MKALYYTLEKTMELREVDLPQPKDDEYLIKVKACGICGSDFEGYMGKTGRRIPPMIMGHEFAGVIETVPGNIPTKYKKGQRVVVFPKPFCGVCDYCQKGMVNICPAGICMGVMDVDGAMCEYVAVKEKYIIPFADTLDFITASMTEPLAVAYRAVSKIDEKDLKTSKNILVVGAGIIGLLILAVLKYRGAKNVIVCDISESRLSIAKNKLSADYTVNPTKEDFIDRIKDITEGKMCDYAIEAVGMSVTANSSIEGLKIGGTVIWVGNAQKMIEVNMQKIVTTEITVKGSYVYDFDSFTKAIKMLEQGKIDVSPLISASYNLEDGVQAFKDLENNKTGNLLKIILEI